MSEGESSAGQPVEVAVLVEGGSLPAAQSIQPEAPLQPPLSAFTEPTELPAAASDAPSMDGTTPATAEGKLPPRSRAKGGRGRGGRGKSNLGKRRATSEAGEESQEPEEEKPLARRTSKRERTKPQAYSPTNQDAETKLRRQALKLQEREGSQALSEDVPEPRRPPLPARKVVKKEEAPEQDSSVEDQPLKLTRRSVSVATSELPAAGPAAGPPATNLPSADGDGSLQEARPPKASTVVEPGAMPVEPNPPELENAKTAEAQPLQTTEEQPPQAQATEAQPSPAAAAQPLPAAEAHPVTTEADLPPAAEAQQTLAAGMGPDHMASRPAVQGNEKATQDAEQATQAGEGPTEAPGQGTQAAEQATPAAEQNPAAAAGSAPPETAVTDPYKPAAVSQEALPVDAEEQPAEAPADAQETAAEPKQEKGCKSRKRQRPVEGLEDGSEEEAKGADAAADDRDHEEAAEGDTQSGSVESDPAAKGGPSKRSKPAGRKRLRKAGAEPSPAKPQQPASGAGVEHKASREVKPAAKQQRLEAAAAGPPDAAGDHAHQPAPQDSRQGPARQRSDEGLQPGKPAEAPLPGAGGTPKERLARDVAQRNERLAAGLEQVSKIFKQAQQQASEALTQMAADIGHLDSLTMTEELLQQTAIGRTMRALAKPMRPLQSAVEVERKAAAVVSRWMKTFQSNKTPGAPAAAAPAGSKAPQGQAQAPPADQPAQPAVQAPPAASQPAAPAPPVAPAGTTAPTAAADAKPAVQRPAQQHAGPQPTAPATASENAAKPFAQIIADATAPPAAQPDEVLKKEQMREEARTILEAAFMPRGTIVPPKMAAGYLESAVFEHHAEHDLGSGKKYLRQLHLLWDWLAPEGESYQPGLAVMVASGNLHPADLAIMSEEQLAELCGDLPSEHLQDAAPELPGSEHPAYGDSEIPS